MRKELAPARKKLQMQSRYVDNGRYHLDVSGCCLAISGDVSSCIVFEFRIHVQHILCTYVVDEKYYDRECARR